MRWPSMRYIPRGMHVYEAVLMKDTPMRDKPMRNAPMKWPSIRGTPMRQWSMGEARL